LFALRRTILNNSGILLCKTPTPAFVAYFLSSYAHKFGRVRFQRMRPTQFAPNQIRAYAPSTPPTRPRQPIFLWIAVRVVEKAASTLSQPASLAGCRPAQSPAVPTISQESAAKNKADAPKSVRL